MANDSFVNSIDKFDVDQQECDNGCHIHVSRTAFKSHKHYSLFYFLINSNTNLLQFIGNRKLTSYCKHRVIGKVHSKQNVHDSDAERQSAVNEKNENTVEIRFFNSSTKPADVKSYIQFVDSLIKYTKYHNDEVSLQKWKAYVNKYSKKYKELVDKLETFEDPMQEVIVFREPIKVEQTIKSLTLAEMNNIISVTKTDGDTWNRRPDSEIHVHNGGVEMKFEETGWAYLSYSDIKKIVIERM